MKLRDWFGRLAEVRELRDRAVKAERDATYWRQKTEQVANDNRKLVAEKQELEGRLGGWELAAKWACDVDARRQHPASGEGDET